MDQLSNLLKNKRPEEPPQLKALRDYVANHHGAKSQTGVSTLGYSLTVPTSALASKLQMEMPRIQEECKLDKKLFIRSGHIE